MSHSMHPKRDFTILGLGLSFGIFLCLFIPTRTFLYWYWSWIIAASVITFIFYGIDKRNSQQNGSRIPEITFHIMTLVGGVFGGWIGRSIFRHKTQHSSFTAVLIIATIIHIAGIILIIIYV